MKAWVFLAIAIVTEVSGSLSLKAAQSHPAWYAAVVVGYVVAFACLAVVLRLGMPLGVAYGVWGASGVALTAAFSSWLFGETFTPLMLLGVVLIIGGVLAVEVGSQRSRAKEDI
ncbi:QacE family quaternary ammonium compound efflux SMR transporter [Micrococcales bacterium 31B]|nr:QacE family quaternary ammonium compound efflux SMR transporter [Micrococcales bacterium 31B]